MAGSGVRVVVQVGRVAVGRAAGAYTGTVGIRSRRRWYKHTMRRKELVEITSILAHADGQVEVLTEGQKVWEEWIGQAVGDTD